MSEPLRFVPAESLVSGWDFSTGSVKCLAFGLDGKTVAEVRLPTDLSNGDPPNPAVSELNLMQLEGQARASVRAVAAELKAAGRLNDWIAGGISATHHTAGRIDRNHNQVRRAICWNDQTLATYRAGRTARRWTEARSRTHRWSLGRPLHLEPSGQGRGSRLLPRRGLAADVSHPAAWAAGGRLPHRALRRDQHLVRRVDRHDGSAELRLVSGHARARWPRRSTAGWPSRSCRESSITWSRSARCPRIWRTKPVSTKPIDHCSFRPPTINRQDWSAEEPSTPGRWP